MTTGKAVNVVARKDTAENTEKEVDVECLKGLDEDPGKVSAMLVERKIFAKDISNRTVYGIDATRKSISCEIVENKMMLKWMLYLLWKIQNYRGR